MRSAKLERMPVTIGRVKSQETVGKQQLVGGTLVPPLAKTPDDEEPTATRAAALSAK